jgi:hypothetical protein
MGTVISFERHRAAASQKPVTWTQVTSEGDEFCSYCLMLLQQLDVVRSGHTIDVPRSYPVASVRSAQKELLDRGYPTDLQEGGEHGCGVLTFH